MKVACASSEMSEYFRPYYPDLYVIGNNDVPPDLDLLIVTGGEDINPSLYGQSPAGAYGWNDIRDKVELRAIRTALSFRNVKVMGVCRGLQIMNAFMGGTLFQHIGNPHRPSHRISDGRKHPLSWLTQVNSLHHQGIRTLGENYESGEILSTADDGIPEIVRWGARALAVQFHPEFFGESLGQHFFSVVNDWVNGKVEFYKEPATKAWKMPASFTVSLQAAEQALANLTTSTTDATNAYASISLSDFTDEAPPIHDEDDDEDEDDYDWEDSDENTEEEDE